MNKIKVVDDNLEKVEIDSKKISLDYYQKECLYAISEIKITIMHDTKLDLEITLKHDTKLNFNIIVLDNAKASLTIKTNGETGKVQYKYTLLENSLIDVFKYESASSIKEMVVVNLNGVNSNIYYNFKTITSLKKTYDYHIFHNAKNTISNIKNNGVCIFDGEIIYKVSSFVPKDITGCIVTQNNRIINMTDNKCEIMPNLYIDSSDVEASHSALIGKFSEDEMFYLESRGIPKLEALKLLITGFLSSDIKDKSLLKLIEKDIKKYWG